MISSLEKAKNIILYAPRVHFGGGYILLKSFINDFISSISYVYFDKRLISKFNDVGLNKYFIKPNIFSLLVGEYSLFKKATNDTTTLCFHGLPPVFPIKGKIMVFSQNSLLFETSILKNFPWKTRIKLYIERVWFKLFFKDKIEYLVQTSSMEKKIKKFLGEKAKISLINTSIKKRISLSDFKEIKKIYNFIYISSGDPHKNHINLLYAWKILASENIYPSLVLTVDEKIYPNLCNIIKNFTNKFSLRILNLGQLDNIIDILANSNALIFPSLTESLGLPLLEAKELGIPVIASDKDFVYDSVMPSETFDPLSEQSIANAVKRFLKKNINTI